MRTRTVLVLVLLVGVSGCNSITAPVSQIPSAVAVTATVTHVPTPMAMATTMPTATLALPTLMPTYTVDAAMYQPVIEAFFKDSGVRSITQRDVIKQRVVYIEPTFSQGTPSQTKTLVPPEIMQLILQQTAQLTLTQVLQEQKGGIIIGLSLPERDSEKEKFVGREGLMIWMSINVSGEVCYSMQSNGYFLTKEATGWKAQQIAFGMC